MDDIGSGRAIQFDGLDDYINLGNVYDDLQLPVTISAWVKVDPDMTYAFPIFNSQDNLPIYNGVTFAVSPVAFSIQYGDGQGENNPAFRRGKSTTIPNISGRWVNLTGVMRTRSDMDLYLNGINIGGQYSGDSNLPMASVFPNDDAKIGYWFSNGITTYFKGEMDELKIFNRSLSQTEIREQMCRKLTALEPGLIGYWTFDETNGNVLVDKSLNKFNGILEGNPTRVFSGAPIGDESLFTYTDSWSNKSLSLIIDEHKFSVNNIRGNPYGVHIYAIGTLPSQTNGLNSGEISEPYFGTFLVSDDDDNLFDASLSFNGQASCEPFTRSDNSNPDWQIIDSSLKNNVQRGEVIGTFGPKLNLDLGADKMLCGESSFLLQSGISDPEIDLQWSSGQNTSQITVTRTGTYWVKASSDCGSVSDTVDIVMEKFPDEITLPDDQRVCVVTPSILKPVQDPTGLDFTWQDGSKLPTFKVVDFGSYWVTVKNGCGEEKDTITFSKVDLKETLIPNVITPNGDRYNERFLVNEELKGLVSLEVFNRWGHLIYRSSQYNNDWSGEDLSSGTYFYRLLGNCVGEKKGSISILK